MSISKEITVRAIAVLCCFAVSGCAVWMTNAESPIKLDGCHVWSSVVDTTASVGLGSAAIVADRSDVLPQEDKTAYMVSSIILATVFAMSAYMGYADYNKCEE